MDGYWLKKYIERSEKVKEDNAYSSCKEFEQMEL